eukprot:CAMPEP_0204421126 /NCGR_PEP_ID=MMETSP0470-20130426/34215_1 /ASSEMBLY_ACC=CAM_ASM_000385 /TAXON_ID=2969 /ORGANISM="Oxyrrhis marina" /LENGTH=114 /DNA_ID=CAMNT_0051418189 /DNA_START=337 /DNA_END=682 /DNA_ORIENTATION=+
MTWLKTEVLRWDATLLHAVAASAVVSVMLRIVLAVLLRCAEPEVRAITGECCAFMCVTVAMAIYATAGLEAEEEMKTVQPKACFSLRYSAFNTPGITRVRARRRVVPSTTLAGS